MAQGQLGFTHMSIFDLGVSSSVSDAGLRSVLQHESLCMQMADLMNEWVGIVIIHRVPQHIQAQRLSYMCRGLVHA